MVIWTKDHMQQKHQTVSQLNNYKQRTDQRETEKSKGGRWGGVWEEKKKTKKKKKKDRQR